MATATDVKTRFGEYLEKAQRSPVFVEKTRRPVAVLISMEEYERLTSLENDYWAQRAIEAAAEGFADEAETRAFMEKGLKHVKA